MQPIASALASGGLSLAGIAVLAGATARRYGHAPPAAGDRGPFAPLVAAGAAAAIGVPFAAIGAVAVLRSPGGSLVRALGAHAAMAGAGMIASAVPGAAIGWSVLERSRSTRLAPGTAPQAV